MKTSRDASDLSDGYLLPNSVGQLSGLIYDLNCQLTHRTGCIISTNLRNVTAHPFQWYVYQVIHLNTLLRAYPW